MDARPAAELEESLQPSQAGGGAARGAAEGTPGWWWPVLLLTLGGVLAGWPGWADVVRFGVRDEENSQVLLAPVVFAWLLAVRWPKGGRFASERHAYGPALALFGWGLGAWGFYSASSVFWHVGTVLLALGAALTVLPGALLRRFLPALAVLVFVVPVPGLLRQEVAGPMQTATAAATAWSMETVGLDVARRGNVLVFNGEDIAVAEACNGMRMVFVLVLVSYAAAFARPLHAWVRVTVLVLSPLTAIVCNVLRLVPTVYLYGKRPGSAEADAFHDYSGWVMIFVGFGLVMGAIELMRWIGLPVVPGDEGRPGKGGGKRHVIERGAGAADGGERALGEEVAHGAE